MKKVQKKYRDLAAEDLVRIIGRVADNQKALDVVALDVRGLASFADFFVIMGGTSSRHVQGLADLIDREIASKRMKSAETEGLNEGQWILLDYNDVIVHIFHHESRPHYDLEGLWHDAPRLDLSVPAPVVAEAAVKKPAKKAAAPGKAKAAAKPAGRAAKKSAEKSKPARAGKKPATGAAKRAGNKSAAKATGKPAGKAVGKATGRPAAKVAGKAAAPKRRSSGGAKK